ncbi:hypothetical protein D0469_09185 [Peribacillus saganii]|uniref:Uncharacterized protein n=1 Tax=Peribacillus saganii TaxID=2303992 RepID=A0A372LP54_9BACI|nr:hypothetical protein [Peribacillus saganii]RFU69529.1 hypothetical protein D0469_09185 [Peribacillus saganii]
MKAKNKLIVAGTLMILLAISFLIINNKSLIPIPMNTKDTGLTAKSNDPQKMDELENETKSSQSATQDENQNERVQPASKDENQNERVQPASKEENQNQSALGETDDKNIGTPPAEGDPQNIAAPVGIPAGEDRSTETETAVPEKPKSSGGLHFSSRQEAIQFGLSRFSAEEIAIYNKASKNGLTPEQEAMALKMAYSRFSAEEIAAIEEALGQ